MGKQINWGNVIINDEYFPDFASSYRELYLLVGCPEGPLNLGERALKTNPSLTPARPGMWRGSRASWHRSRSCFFPARNSPVCWELKRNSLMYVQRAGASGCPNCRLPGSRDSCAPALAGEVSSPGTWPRSGTAGMAGMLLAGRELEIKQG